MTSRIRSGGLMAVAVLVLVVLSAGWMVFDGARALLVGDYVTPSEGEYAGQLGAWADVLRAVEIEPRSTLVKCAFVAYGAVWLIAAAAFIFRPRTLWPILLILAIGALWYVIPGTVLAALQIVMLLVWRRAAQRRGAAPAAGKAIA